MTFEERQVVKKRIDEIVRKRERVEEIEHGTYKAYREGCECRPCKTASSAAQNARLKRQQERERRVAEGTYVPCQAARTHCRKGHEFTEENTYTHHRGGGRLHRQCRACRDAYEQARLIRRRKRQQVQTVFNGPAQLHLDGVGCAGRGGTA